MAGQSSPFQVGFNDKKSIGPLAFIARSVGVDNPTPFYVHFPDAGFGAWVRPFTGGAIVPAPTADKYINVSAQDAPAGAFAPTASTALVASCLAYEDLQPFSAGYSLGGATHIVVAPMASRNPGTYQFPVSMPSGAKGVIAYLVIKPPGGGGTCQMSLLNSDVSILGSPGHTDDLLDGAAVSASGENLYCYPGTTVTTNVAAAFPVGVTPTLQVTVATSAATFEVDFDPLF